jgi:hypothetical protein
MSGNGFPVRLNVVCGPTPGLRNPPLLYLLTITAGCSVCDTQSMHMNSTCSNIDTMDHCAAKFKLLIVSDQCRVSVVHWQALRAQQPTQFCADLDLRVSLNAMESKVVGHG